MEGRGDILPAHCNRQCPDVTCRDLLRQLLDEVTVVEISGEPRAYVSDTEMHARASSQFVQRLALCIGRQTLYTSRDESRSETLEESYVLRIHSTITDR